MLPHSATAIVTRNDTWEKHGATEPHEAGWAREAIFFVRALDAKGPVGRGKARVQISADGIRWVDEGTTCKLPARTDAVTFARVAQFGNYLRLVAELPRGASLKVLVALSLKA